MPTPIVFTINPAWEQDEEEIRWTNVADNAVFPGPVEDPFNVYWRVPPHPPSYLYTPASAMSSADTLNWTSLPDATPPLRFNDVVPPRPKPKLKHYRLRAFPREVMVEMLTKTGSVVTEDAMGIIDKPDLVIMEKPDEPEHPRTNYRTMTGYPGSGFWVPIEVCEEIKEGEST